jgi:hypothetical protein
VSRRGSFDNGAQRNQLVLADELVG